MSTLCEPFDVSGCVHRVARPLRTMLAFAWLALGGMCCAPANAGVIEQGSVTLLPVTSDDDNMMQAWIGASMRRYAYGMRRWLGDALSGSYGRVSDSAELLRFQQQLRRATFSHFQYSYTVEGVEYTRIYLGVSGRPFNELINPAFRGTRRLVPPVEESNYFDTDNVVLFGSVGAVEASEVTPRPATPGSPQRANDAEIKVLQAIMRDIREGTIQPGGRLLGFVSQIPCESCTAALRQFSIEAQADVHINYVEGHPGSPRTMTPALAVIRSMRNVLIDELTTTFAPPVHSVLTSAEAEADDGASTSMCSKP